LIFKCYKRKINFYNKIKEISFQLNNIIQLFNNLLKLERIIKNKKVKIEYN